MRNAPCMLFSALLVLPYALADARTAVPAPSQGGLSLPVRMSGPVSSTNRARKSARERIAGVVSGAASGLGAAPAAGLTDAVPAIGRTRALPNLCSPALLPREPVPLRGDAAEWERALILRRNLHATYKNIAVLEEHIHEIETLIHKHGFTKMRETLRKYRKLLERERRIYDRFARRMSHIQTSGRKPISILSDKPLPQPLKPSSKPVVKPLKPLKPAAGYKKPQN